VSGYGNDVTRRSQNAMISETHMFSTALVNDLRFAFNRVASAVRQENQGVSVNQAVGLPELSSNPRDFGLSFITVTGFIRRSDTRQQSAEQRDEHVSDSGHGHLFERASPVEVWRRRSPVCSRTRFAMCNREDYFSSPVWTDYFLMRSAICCSAFHS
jgi:hypothetical protein